MTRCFRLFCCATGAMVALGAAGCGSMSRLAGSRLTSGSGSNAKAPGAIGSFIASVDVKRGSITFRPDKASTARKARVAAQQFGPGDRLALSGTASLSNGMLSGSVQFTSSNTFPLNDARVVVTSISDTSVTIANADGKADLLGTGTKQCYWDYVTLDPNVPITKSWQFNNPSAVNFTFRVTVFANVWNYALGDANNNTAVSFPDPVHGWIVGLGGKVLHTADGGVTWQGQNAGINAGVQLEGVSFVDQYNGWIVGTAGTIRHTGDGGRTWYTQAPNTDISTYNLHAVRFIDSATGWIVGHGGLILKTTNSGNTWTLQASPRDGELYNVDFTNANNGWVVGDLGTILHTTNGGSNWSLQSVPGNSTGLLQGVTARDATHAWVCGANGQILYTTNGISWNQGSSGVNDSALSNIFFINSTTGWAVGGRWLLKSTDGGLTWAPKNGNSLGLSGIRFTDVNNGWAVGPSGTILHSTDGGETWTLRQQSLSITYNGVAFPDHNHGWVVGDDGKSGFIRATVDGGQNWFFQGNPTSNILRGVCFKDPMNGWIVGQNGTILHTADGGNTWAAQASGVTQLNGSGPSLVGVDFVDTSHGCVVGSFGTVLYTADGGNTWAPMLIPSAANLSGVSMVSADIIYVAGSTGTILTTINGSQGSQASWQQEFQPFTDDLTSIRMLDANTGWAVGSNGRILHTIDGATWDSQHSEPGTTNHTTNTLYGADFEAIPLPTPAGSPQKYKYAGWAVGDGGRVLRTTNGGATWITLNVGTINSLRAFRFTDPDSGWAVGASGTMQHLN